MDLLKNEFGQEHVLNSTDENFDSELAALSKKLGANVALEAVAGEMPGALMMALGKKGIIIQYGLLSEKKIGPINPIYMIFKSQRIEGFLLPYWLNSKSYWGMYQATRQARALVQETKMNKCYGLHQVKEAIEFYQENMTAGKIYLRPSLTE